MSKHTVKTQGLHYPEKQFPSPIFQDLFKMLFLDFQANMPFPPCFSLPWPSTDFKYIWLQKQLNFQEQLAGRQRGIISWKLSCTVWPFFAAQRTSQKHFMAQTLLLDFATQCSSSPAYRSPFLHMGTTAALEEGQAGPPPPHPRTLPLPSSTHQLVSSLKELYDFLWTDYKRNPGL